MDGSKKTNKNIWTLVMNTHEHPWAPMSTWARMSTHEQWAPINSHEFLWMFMEASCVRIKNQLAIYMLNHMSHSFKLLCLVFCYSSFWCKLFFWTLFLCLCVMYCCFVLCWLCTPGSNPLLQNMVFDTYISYIYIYVCVGVSQNEVSFFPRKATVLEPKKDTSCWDIPRWVCVCVHIYMYVKLIFFWHAFFFYPVLVCPIPKILYFFLHVVWQPHRIRKNCIKPKHAPLKVTISK